MLFKKKEKVVDYCEKYYFVCRLLHLAADYDKYAIDMYTDEVSVYNKETRERIMFKVKNYNDDEYEKISNYVRNIKVVEL